MPSSVIDRWWPVTYDFGLIRAPVETVLEASQAMWHEAGLAFDMIDLHQPLETCFQALEPLSPVPTKELFLATNFGWTAFFRNGTRGSDPFLPMSKLARALETTAMRVCVSPAKAAYPAVIWEVYDGPASGGDKWGYRRSIAAANDGGAWVFQTSGEPYSFEEIQMYSARRKRDRFTADMLYRYLAEFGIPPILDQEFQIGAGCKGGMLARPAHSHIPVYALRDIMEG